MGKSARILGYEFGRNAQQMNELLKENGYLYGEPGAYGLTEKGEQFGAEQDHHRGTGGYAHYNRDWTTRTWGEGISAALRADMAATPSGPSAEAAAASSSPSPDLPDDDEDAFEYRPIPYFYDGDEDEDAGTWKDVALEAAVVVAFAAAPLAKPFWDNKVKPVVWDGKLKPAAHKLRARFSKQKPSEIPDGEPAVTGRVDS